MKKRNAKQRRCPKCQELIGPKRSVKQHVRDKHKKVRDRTEERERRGVEGSFFQRHTITMESGTKLGHYEILSAIGGH